MESTTPKTPVMTKLSRDQAILGQGYRRGRGGLVPFRLGGGPERAPSGDNYRRTGGLQCSHGQQQYELKSLSIARFWVFLQMMQFCDLHFALDWFAV